MKKMKGVASYGPVHEDQRALFKYQSLLQDYEELYKETEAKKKKLEMMKQRRLILLDEVRFLRWRYRYLTQNQAKDLPPGQGIVDPQQTVVPGGKSSKKGRNQTGSGAALRCPAPRPDSKGKRKVQKEQAVKRQSPADVNRKQKSYTVGAELSNSTDDAPNSSQGDRIRSGKETTVRNNNVPMLDLNQISREEEEIQANDEITRLQESPISLNEGGNDEHPNNGMKLSVCRNIGTSSSQVGKRKISWQDPVALRVEFGYCN